MNHIKKSLCALTVVLASKASGQLVEPEEQLPIYNLPAYSVVATKTPLIDLDVPASITIISAENFNRWGVADAADMIKYEPLVSLPFDIGGSDPLVPYDSAGYSAYSIRGMGGNRVLLQIDGIRQPEIFNQSGGSRTDFFDPAVFASLEILKGSGSSLYGSDALGGVIALNTRSARSNESFLELSGRYSTANDGVQGLVIGNQAHGKINILAVHSHRYEHERQNYGYYDENPEDNRSNHSLVNVTYDWNEKHRTSFVAEYFERSQYIDMESNKGFEPLLALNITEAEYDSEQDRTRLSVDHHFNVADDRNLNVKAYWQESNSHTQNYQVGESFFGGAVVRDRSDTIDFGTDIFGTDGIYTFPLQTGEIDHRIIFGLSASLSHSENYFTRIDRAPVLVEEDLIGMAPSDTYRGAVFLQDEVKIGRFLIIPGLRFEHYRIKPDNVQAYLDRLNSRIPPSYGTIEAEEFELNSIAPSLAISYELTEESRLYARYARGYRQPTAEELTGIFIHGGDFVTLPNSDLEEETSDSFEIGYKRQGKFTTVSAAVFYNKYDNFIQTVFTGELLDPTDPLSLEIQQVQNVAKAEVYGYEVATSLQLAAIRPEWDEFEAIFTFGQAFGEDKETGDYLASIDPFKAVAGLRWTDRDGKFGFDLNGTYRAKMDKVPPTPAGTTSFIPDSSFVVDLTGYYQITDNLRLTAGILNLFDEEYHLWSNSNQGIHYPDEPDRTTQPGINFYTGLSYRF